MSVRLAAHPVDRFLSAGADDLYGEHATGLWLYDETIPGGPGAFYDGFRVTRSNRVAGKKDTWVVSVRIPLTWVGDAPSGEITEVLTVGPGHTSGGSRKQLLVLDAFRRSKGPDESEGLPLPVAITRHDIRFAALDRDYAELERLTNGGNGFTYSFGESGDPIGYWRGLEEGEVPILGDIIQGVLHTRFAKQGGVFVWPAAHAKDPSDWSEKDRQDMRTLGYTKRDIARFGRAGGYADLRVGIRRDGRWLFFVAGD